MKNSKTALQQQKKVYENAMRTQMNKKQPKMTYGFTVNRLFVSLKL